MTRLLTTLISSSILFLFATQAFANKTQCRYERGELTKIEDDRPISEFNEKDIYADDWACLEIEKNVKGDSLKKCLPSQESVNQFVPSKQIYVTGTAKYKALFLSFHKPYRYFVSPTENGGTSVTVKIHFTGELMADPKFTALVQPKLDLAAALWTKQSPDKKIEFHFLSVAADDSPGFSVELKPRNGDLYYKSWDSELFKSTWGQNTIAHEVGHMMGLTDEYDPVRDTLWQVKSALDTLQCNIRGMMCDTYKPKTYPYYYYLILRRAVCPAPSTDS